MMSTYTVLSAQAASGEGTGHRLMAWKSTSVDFERPLAKVQKYCIPDGSCWLHNKSTNSSSNGTRREMGNCVGFLRGSSAIVH